MFKLYNSSDSAVEVQTDVDTFLLMPKSVSLVEGKTLTKTATCVQVLEQPSVDNKKSK